MRGMNAFNNGILKLISLFFFLMSFIQILDGLLNLSEGISVFIEFVETNLESVVVSLNDSLGYNLEHNC